MGGTSTTIYVAPSEMALYVKLAEKKGCSVSQVVREITREWLESTMADERRQQTQVLIDTSAIYTHTGVHPDPTTV